MKMILRLGLLGLFALSLFVSLPSCEIIEGAIADSVDVEVETEADYSDHGTGNDYEEELKSLETMPHDISLAAITDIKTQNNLASVNLRNYMPPIGNQGPYGTCTAWGTGYYTRSIMYAREHNLSKADMENPDNYFSPKYLFLNTKYHDTECNGSNPAMAFKAIQEVGIATWSAMPYENMNCAAGTSSADGNAGNYKIDSYRYVKPKDVSTLKSYLSMGRPLQISCKLGLDFSAAARSGVIYDLDYSGEPSNHGRHAMCLVGYDDNKGVNGAFLVVNSWGDYWGDEGFLWVDYDFFTAGEFCYSAYVIECDKGGLVDGLINEAEINPSMLVAGKDLLTVPYELVDRSATAPRSKTLKYNVFNKGTEAIAASSEWAIIFYYYNAYDPEHDNGIILYDLYTDKVGIGHLNQSGEFASVTGLQPYGDQNWWNYVDIPSGKSVGSALGQATNGGSYDYHMEWDFDMPNLTGKYYLCLMADGLNAVEEQYEQNNFRFLTAENGQPLEFSNGVIQNVVAKKNGKTATSHTGELLKEQPNAYRTNEIAGLIGKMKRTGEFKKKAASYLKSAKAGAMPVGTKRIVKGSL